MQIPFVGPAYRSRSLPFAAQRCVNLYLQSDEGKGGKVPAALIGTPGLRAWTTLGGQNGIRALYPASNGFLIAVRGTSVYYVNAAGVATFIGSVGSFTGPVSIVDNGAVAALVDGAARYAIDLNTWAFTTIAGGGADRVAFIDGYFAANRPQTGQFEFTEVYSTTVDPTSFAAAEGSPDRLVTLIEDHRELWLFGQISTEVWVTTDNLDLPFQRVAGAFIQTGCIAPHSPVRMDNSIFWLGADERGSGVVWRADGYRPQRVSTHAIETEIQKYAAMQDAVGMAYQQAGHTFYLLTFPSADRTWCFDAATGEWHERAWFDDLNTQHRHRASCVAQFAGKIVAGDWETGALYTLDLDTYTDAGRPIRRIRTAQPIATPDFEQQVFAALQVDMDTGNGIQAD